MIYIGTSGFSYDEWKGTFYPDLLSKNKFLSFYGQQFKTTEINNTFYRFPSSKTSRVWADQVPSDFRFAVKLSQRVTHKKRLRDVDEEMGWFKKGVEPLRSRLGAVLVQLPPWARSNLEVLEEFLASHAAAFPLAFEFRHESWKDAHVLRLLSHHKAALVLAETDKDRPERKVAGSFCYVRLRKTDYTPAQLLNWANWLKNLNQPTFVYLKHARQAPLLCRTLEEYLGQPSSEAGEGMRLHDNGSPDH